MEGKRACCVSGAARWSALSVLVFLIGVPTVRAQATDGPTAASRGGLPPTAETALRLARSADGLTFTPVGDALFSGASAPDLTLLSNGRLLLIADFSEAKDPSRTFLAATKARGRGSHWTKPRRLRFKGSRSKPVNARHGSVVVESSHGVRLYFTTDAALPTRRRAEIETVIRSATSRNGVAYRLRPAPWIRTDDYTDADATVTRHKGRTHLFIAGDVSVPTASGAAAEHFLSDTGDRFARLSPVVVPGAVFRGCVVDHRRGMRAYLTTNTGVASAVSRDGRHWKPEPGLRLTGGWDPAVVRLKDGSYLMVYCTKLDSSAVASSTRIAAEPAEEYGDGADGVVVVDGGGGDGTSSGDGEPSGTDGASPVDGEARVAVVADEMNPETVPDVAGDGFPEPNGDWKDGWDPAVYDGFAPPPDFRTKVDYIEWHRDYAVETPIDNAYDDYVAAFALALGADGETIPIKDLFNDSEYEGPPIAWKPEDHPEWEATSRMVAPWLEAFRKASQHRGFARPAAFLDDEGIDKTYGPLLMGLMLPNLSAHRKFSKAMLADAWRVREDGRPAPGRMLEAWKTIYRSTDHLEQGTTLIEDLVGVAERALVEDTARWALKDGVFRSTEELQSAFDTLRAFDHGGQDPAHALRGEHAFAMDITQYLFSPPTPDGRPKLNAARMNALPEWGGDYKAMQKRLRDMGPDDVYDTIDSFDQYYRELGEQMRIGYPDVRGADVAAAAARHIHTSPLTEAFLPALSRVHQLRARGEASRRATQLAYATELFRRHEGRYPSSLDKLPARYGEEMRIDPFTGRYFGYKLTKDGPRIWTASEDGLDSGGVNAPHWQDHPDPETGSDDHVFWPPQPR